MLGNRFLTLSAVVALAVLFLFGTFQVLAGPSPTPQTPIATDTAIAPSFTTGQVSMNSTAKVIKAAPTTGHSRYSVILQNIGSVSVYVGATNSITTSTGFPIQPGASLLIDRNYGVIYGITGSSTSIISYFEEAR